MEMVIIDLDGVVFKTPSRETVTDRAWWEAYWRDIERHEPNREIEALIRSLIATNVQILFLTSRPQAFRTETIQALHHCIRVRPAWCEDVLHHDFYGVNQKTHLQMKPDRLDDDTWSNSAEWKLSVVRILSGRHHILFAIDDHKANVEAIRQAVPVLSYEMRRGGLQGD